MILTKLVPLTRPDDTPWHDPTIADPLELVLGDRAGSVHGVQIDLPNNLTVRITQYRAAIDGSWSLKIERSHETSIETIATIEP